MSFRLVPKSVTLNDLKRRNGGMAFILRYPTEFGSHVKLCLGLGAFWSWSWSLFDMYGLV